MQHIVQECPRYAKIRESTEAKIRREWAKSQSEEERKEWDWISEGGSSRYEGWQSTWSWMGLVPAGVIEGVYSSGLPRKEAMRIHGLVNSTAVTLLQGTWEMWEQRCEAKEGWENEKGITLAKQEQNKRRWQPHCGPHRKRGRPLKPLAEITSARALLKRTQEMHLHTLAALHGEAEGRRRQGGIGSSGSRGCRVQGAGCRVQGAGCRVPGAGCTVQGGVAHR